MVVGYRPTAQIFGFARTRLQSSSLTPLDALRSRCFQCVEPVCGSDNFTCRVAALREGGTSQRLFSTHLCSMPFRIVFVNLTIFFVGHSLVRPITKWLIFREATHADEHGLRLRFDLERLLIGFNYLAHKPELTPRFTHCNQCKNGRSVTGRYR